MIQLATQAGFGKIVITSAYRTPEHQQQLHDDYKAGRRKLPAACGTCSRHTKGFALDLNFTMNGQLITSKTGGSNAANRAIWENSGFVAIADSLGLEWGGRYKRYDPVHFEWSPSEWGENAEMYKEQMGYSADRNYDVINEGTTAYEAFAGVDTSDTLGFSTEEGENVPGEIAELYSESDQEEMEYIDSSIESYAGDDY